MTNNWVLRALVFAAGMLIVRLVQGVLITTTLVDPTLISVVLLLLFMVAVGVWAYFDGRADATATPDPDRRADLAMTWLLAGLVTGVLSGALAWLIARFNPAIYTGGLVNELTTFASFTALVVFVPAVAAVALGRWQIDRQVEKAPRRHHGLAAREEGADTDVFAAVSGDAVAASAAVSEAPTTVIATVEAPEAPTEELTQPKKRWWQRSKPAAPVPPAATAYTMDDQTQPVGSDEQTTEIPTGAADETTQIPTERDES